MWPAYGNTSSQAQAEWHATLYVNGGALQLTGTNHFWSDLRFDRIRYNCDRFLFPNEVGLGAQGVSVRVNNLCYLESNQECVFIFARGREDTYLSWEAMYSPYTLEFAVFIEVTLHVCTPSPPILRLVHMVYPCPFPSQSLELLCNDWRTVGPKSM